MFKMTSILAIEMLKPWLVCDYRTVVIHEAVSNLQNDNIILVLFVDFVRPYKIVLRNFKFYEYIEFKLVKMDFMLIVIS